MHSTSWPVIRSAHDGSESVVFKGKVIHLTTVDVQKPYPNEHAARQNPPGKYDTFRRGSLPGAPAGISVIWGIRTIAGKKVSEIQALRFSAKSWTPEAAKKWLKDHGFKTAGFEPASKPQGVKKMNRTQDVLVHKAAVPLMKDESVGAFCAALKTAGRQHLLQKYNVDEKKGNAYPVEIYADKAVFMVVPDYSKPHGNDFHVAMKFNRADSGQFNFTDTMKVKPVTSFVAQNEMPVTKALHMDAWAEADSAFAGVV